MKPITFIALYTIVLTLSLQLCKAYSCDELRSQGQNYVACCKANCSAQCNTDHPDQCGQCLNANACYTFKKNPEL